MKKYNQIFCNKCHKITDHRQKLSAVLSGNRVCNICDRMNPVCLLTKEDNLNFSKGSNEILWLEFNEDDTFKEKYDEPKVGRSLLMSPFNNFFTWQTTPILEIIEERVDDNMNYIKFKTKNSIYELTTHKL